MREISRARFDIFAAYARDPRAVLYAKELQWFESESGDVLATLVLDTDGEFSGVLFATDLMERFRWVSQTSFHTTARAARLAIEPEMARVETHLDRARVHGDESAPVDFFATNLDEADLHPRFKLLTAGPHQSAAREVIAILMRWYENQDGNFVEQFQTTAFDARIWELYLFAILVEAGFAVEQPKPAPDFHAVGLDGQFFLEATTINPPNGKGALADYQRPDPLEDLTEYLDHYLPIRFAGPLTNKLSKQYWKSPTVADAPLVIAIQDFHDEMSMVWSGSALPRYLYGFAFDEVADDGVVRVVQRRVTEHRLGAKVVPSSFFDLPDAEHISAVLFNGSGTISKFNRMGVSAGLGRSDVVLLHHARRLTERGPDTGEPSTSVVVEDYGEAWIDGLNVYHNPRATHPLDPDLLPGAAHHRVREGQFESWFPPGHLVSSTVAVIHKTGTEDAPPADDTVTATSGD